MSKKSRKKRISTLPNEPIGLLPDGSINFVSIDDPPFRPLVLNEQGQPVDIAALDRPKSDQP